jgi:hypothetical protein
MRGRASHDLKTPIISISEEFFQHQLPFERASISGWRKRMAEERLRALLQQAWPSRPAPAMKPVSQRRREGGVGVDIDAAQAAPLAYARPLAVSTDDPSAWEKSPATVSSGYPCGYLAGPAHGGAWLII